MTSNTIISQLRKELYELKNRKCKNCKYLDGREVEEICTFRKTKYPMLEFGVCGKWEKQDVK